MSGDPTCTCDAGYAAPTCATCAADYTMESGACIDSKQVDCADAAPANATSTIVLVTVTYTTSGGWTQPEACAWTCDSGYQPSSDACIPDGCPADYCNGHGICDLVSGNPTCTCDAGYEVPRCATCATGYTMEGEECRPDDNTAPTVVSTDPKNMDTEVPLDRKISITFSEPIDVSRISPANFELIEWWDGYPQGAPLAGTLDTSGNPTIVFVPDARFGINDQLRFTVKAGIEDLAGNPLATDYSFIFDAARVTPEQTPAIVSVAPADGATGVSTTTAIVLTFNKKMSESVDTSSTVQLTSNGTAVTMQRDSVRDIAFVFHPQEPLQPNTTYHLTVMGGASGVKDEADNQMPLDFTSTFTTGTGPDGTALEVLSVTPSHGATGVGQVPSVTVTFNKPVQPSSLFPGDAGRTGTFRLDDSDGPLVPKEGTLDFSANPTVTFTLDPATALVLERTYYLRIMGGSAGVKAISGATLAADFESTFTVKGPDNDDATVADLRAADGPCALRVKGLTMTYYRDLPKDRKGFFVQKGKTGPGIFVVTGNDKPGFPIYPDPSASGFPNIDLTVSKVTDDYGFKEVIAHSMTKNGDPLDLETVRETLVQVIGDVALGADHESEYVQVDGTLGGYKPGSSAENREFDLAYGTGRKVKVKVSQPGIMIPMGLANGAKVRVTAPLQKDKDGYFLKPYVYTIEQPMTAAELDDPANYDYALDIVKLAP